MMTIVDELQKYLRSFRIASFHGIIGVRIEVRAIGIIFKSKRLSTTG